jgi:FtsP/CotA-like multicopper oxidase with cupredoxin domain
VELKNSDVYKLTASIVKKNIAGSTVKMLAYNGSVPGPTIKVQQGSEVIIHFTNNTDVDTTIHPHGIRGDSKFDGVPEVSQKPVKPGESFDYKLKFPDAGVYWYHPHMREDYAQELGLYGNFLVIPKGASFWSPVNQEATLMVDDILIESGKVVPFNTGQADHALMGRFGNTMLVNGSTNYTFNAKQGEVVRFYITNSANTRVFNLSIPNAKMKLVGADNGKYERESFVDSVILAPSERAIVEVLFEKSGTFSVEHRTPQRTYTLGTIAVSTEQAAASYAKEFTTLRTNADVISTIDPFRSEFSRSPDKTVALTVDLQGGMGGMMSGGHGQHRMPNGEMMDNIGMGMTMGTGEKIEWEDTMAMMNTASTPDTVKWKIVDTATNKSGMDIDWKFKVGDKVRIRIVNDPKSQHPMQHPIHFHGQRFLVLATNGVPSTNLVWKDTTLVQNGDTVDILVDMSNPGTWMAHCHIAEHLESGMMFPFTVLE